MQIALKVDVDTYRGTCEGVPALLALFERYGVKATFLFSMGPDHTGRALRRVLRPGFLRKVHRTSVVEHYGIKTLLYGVLLPGPDIGRKAGHLMNKTFEQGHEVGLHCYDHVRWQDAVAGKNKQWTENEMRKAYNAFRKAVGINPTTLGAAGWQLNKYVLALEESMGFRYASDVRGYAPFYPILDGVTSQCVQIPTTVPTLDELIGRDTITSDNVHEVIREAVRRPVPHGHVYTLHAELEGMKWLPVMERLLRSWLSEGVDIVTLSDIYRTLDLTALPRKNILWREVEGRSGVLACEDCATLTSATLTVA
ncbi:MAG: polysaccharide deacetylase family protein [Exilibacterium sp.]